MNAINQAETPCAPGVTELVERAHAMIPALRANAAEVEKARSVPKETIDAFKEAGFFKILQPRRWGGWEMDPSVFSKVLMELGRGCPSSAWNMMILGVHQWEFGLFDERAGNDMWAADNSVLVASSYAPFGKCRKVDGGWMLSGEWKTSSGCDHAQGGAILGAFELDDEGNRRDTRSFLVSREDYDIIDDWFVVGLAGTGSKSVRIKGEAFIPDYRSHSVIDYTKTDRETPYLHPFNQVFYASVSSVIIGFARGMIDLYIEQMKPRQNIMGPAGAAAQNPYVKDKLGNAALLVRSAQARLAQVFEEASAYVQRGELVPLHDRVFHFLEIQRCGKDCLDASMMLWKKLSARAIGLNNPVQLWMRAMLVAANHITQNEDDNAGVLGGYLLGQGVPPFIYNLPEVPACQEQAA
ncbi:acyl-CoA dehydrogenase family protein [Paraburkholderia unamae]|uniref:3-hydroxy-9,10-secoandrosta-1,3,5(10)-triene-9, 17-dione monooxygenase n=1 Tax=Paraburkholderia unamae TaxID=219649 RepID=A0ABX5KDK6_9BURK|nr:acyl-CoA dehydrogenase family protein [Paraburkholderia unamae]PVX75200.1 3-hydroxy-9,10-secoandrosta-1,3,5(10)-triene-9,17-dione monooxygenase [Paraburkholderia unamae]